MLEPYLRERLKEKDILLMTHIVLGYPSFKDSFRIIETMVEAGYQPESAYFEVMHELKLIVDLLYEGGMEYMRYSVSDTAEYGDYTRGPRVIDDSVRDEMEQILAEIQDGTFAREWVLENQAGRPSFNALRRMDTEHMIEEVGRELRQMMPWLKKG